MRDSHARLAVVSVLAGLLLTGQARAAEPPDPSKAEYIAQVSAICEERSRVLSESAKPEILGENSSLESMRGHVIEMLAIAGRYTDRIAAVRPPAADAQRIRTGYIDVLRRQSASARKAVDHLAASGSTSGGDALSGTSLSEFMRLLNDAGAQKKKAADFARSYGLTKCVGD
jgi:hypothetical protein